MSEQFGSRNDCEGGYRPGYGRHMGMFIPFVIPLAIGFMLGMRKGMMRHGMGMGPGRTWEHGVPPFFAEMHRRAHAAEAAQAQPQAPAAEA